MVAQEGIHLVHHTIIITVGVVELSLEFIGAIAQIDPIILGDHLSLINDGRREGRRKEDFRGVVWMS